MTRVIQSVCAHMSVDFDWVIDVINSDCISIQKKLLERNIHNERLKI